MTIKHQIANVFFTVFSLFLYRYWRNSNANIEDKIHKFYLTKKSIGTIKYSVFETAT